jgi:uncharacterized protein
VHRDPAEERFLEIVRADPTVRVILERGPELGVGDWWLTAGVLFQTVWNSLTGRPAGTGIRDADFFYFDADTSWDAEDDVIRAGGKLFADLPMPVEIRNEARVHLWYADRFGIPAPPFRDCRDAIDHFAAICCCYGVTAGPDGEVRVHAPHGFDDLSPWSCAEPHAGASRRLRGHSGVVGGTVAGADRPAVGRRKPGSDPSSGRSRRGHSWADARSPSCWAFTTASSWDPTPSLACRFFT